VKRARRCSVSALRFASAPEMARHRSQCSIFCPPRAVSTDVNGDEQVLRRRSKNAAIDDKLCSLDVSCLIRREKEDGAGYIFGPADAISGSPQSFPALSIVSSGLSTSRFQRGRRRWLSRSQPVDVTSARLHLCGTC